MAKLLMILAIGDYSYKDTFGGSKNLLYPMDFETGSFSPATINAGTPNITDENYKTKPYSLQAFGNTSQQILTQGISFKAGHTYYLGCFVNVKRYVKGYAGMLLGSCIIGVNYVTDGYVLKSCEWSFDSATNDMAFIGTWSSADIDAYVDNPVVIDMTEIAANKEQLDTLLNIYAELCNIDYTTIHIPTIDSAIKNKYATVVLDAVDSASRFSATKELLDIAIRKETEPSYIVKDSDFVGGNKGIVCKVPNGSTALYEQYPFDIIYSKNADVQTLPASTTKVVSLVTAMPYITSVMEKVTLTSDDIQAGSGNFFYAGDVMTIEDLMLGMMLPSSNTCAMAFAHHIGKKILGNDSASYSDCISAFVSEMNRKASILGCSNSAFDTPSGLSKTNKTTAEDLLKFLIEACSWDEILRVWNKKAYTIKVGGTNARDVELETTVTDANLETDYYIFGGKTGSLDYGDGTVARALVMVAESK